MTRSRKRAVGIDLARTAGDWPAQSALRAIARKVLDAGAASGLKLPDGAGLSILFTDDAEMRRLNAQWRGIDKPTNVLSFPGPAGAAAAGEPFLGDIALGAETVKRESETDGVSFADHLAHLIVHGLLHLLGYDHLTKEEAETMESLEVAILGRMGIADPYAGRPLS